MGTLRLDIKEDQAYLSRFAVDRNCRNSGVGKSLMSMVDKYLMDKKVNKVFHTSSKHTLLMRFYYGRIYTEEIETDRGYLRAKLVKEYNYL